MLRGESHIDLRMQYIIMMLEDGSRARILRVPRNHPSIVSNSIKQTNKQKQKQANKKNIKTISRFTLGEVNLHIPF